MEVVAVDKKYQQVTVRLDIEDIEFIGNELPQGDQFTKLWWDMVHSRVLDTEVPAREPKVLFTMPIQLSPGEDPLKVEYDAFEDFPPYSIVNHDED